MTQLVLYFSLFSLISVGGVNALMPEIHRVTVDANHWMTSAEFTQLFAVSQAAPGPNVLIVSLIGWKLAGLPGALAGLAAICGPAATLSYWVGGYWDRLRDAPWRPVVQRGILPVTVGLVLASGYVIAAPDGLNWHNTLIASGSALIMYATRINPLWILFAGGALGGLLLG
ncbi:MAG: chromate transporter [Betaproteobacteria bacterium]|nr:chromate transporter [Betaproteobacteria bacterium]